ncbi:MAG TPA: glycosyltransferase family 4 protein [Xanthobacteraceae bacterium]|jgi:glycosyltransferase involved in cell wall biosynthesis|nr:glycosyltransferase family 4 protein [Xanthobacteraceae bacterium]
MSPPSNPFRILMTADAVGGVWTFATTLTQAIVARGCQVHLVTLGPQPRPDQLAGLSGLTGLDIEITDLALEWLDPKGIDLLRATEQLRLIEQRFDPDVIHLNSYREALTPFRAPVLITAHSCVVSWWNACRGGTPTDPDWKLYRTHIHNALGAVDAWVAPTAAFKNDIEKFYSPLTRGAVVSNGVSSCDRSTRKLPIILAAGRLWDEAKNVGILEYAAARLDWPIHVVGSTSLNEDHKLRYETRRLKFLGEVPHTKVAELMARAAIFVAPALYEPFGLSVLEAAASGCALVLADIPSFRELWNDAAWFVNPRDEREIHSALSHLSHDTTVRNNLQKAALQRAAQYTASKMADRYLSIYNVLREQRSFSGKQSHYNPEVAA